MVRQFQPCDGDTVMQIWLEENKRTHYFMDKNYWELHFTAVKEAMLEAQILVFMASNGEIQGFLGMDGTYICGIFVHHAMQSKGIGKMLLDAAKSEKNCLTLHVYCKNSRAISFYQREGFVIVSEGINKETREKELEMRWEKQRISAG